MTAWTVTFAPLLPPAVLAGLALLGLVLVIMLALARTRGTWLRTLTLAILLATLADPSIRGEEREELSDIAVAVIDRSLSQEAAGRLAAVDQAARTLGQQIAALPKTELRTIEVRSGIGPNDDGTRAFEALGRALADIPPERFAGALMLTDGQVHDAPADAATLGGPLQALITGSRRERDRKVVIDRAPRFGMVGKEQTLSFHIEETNGDGGPLDVAVTLAGGTTQTLSAAPGEPVEVTVPLDHGGQNILEIAVPPMAGEISVRNNRAVSVIEGVRDRLRVLLVSGEPHPGERAWRNLLKSDASVDLVHFTILRPPEKQDGTPTKELALIAFPTRELFVDKLDEFDLVIFDRYSRQTILPSVYMSNVARYVEEGGAVLIASGPDLAEENGLYATPLADVIAAAPTGRIIETPFRPALTPAGRKHPVTRELPGGGEQPNWGRWFRLVDTSVTTGETVMSGPDERPLLVLARIGKGRLAQLLSDQGWLWSRGFEGGGPQSELLRRMAHWLMQEPDLEEEALGATQSGAKLVIERRTMADRAEPVTVTLPSGKTVTAALAETSPGRFQASLPVTEAGLYRLSDGRLEAVAAGGSGNARETASLVATADVLAPIAAASGGAVTWIEEGLPQVVKISGDRPRAGAGWIGLRANGAHRVTAIVEIPLFASLLSLGALLLAVCAMWYREGR